MHYTSLEIERLLKIDLECKGERVKDKITHLSTKIANETLIK